VPRTTNAIEFENAIRTVCEPVFDKPIAELSFGQLLLNLFQTASRFDMPIQPSLVLLQKTLLNIEGLGRELYPQLNLWDTAQPFLERWMRERYSLPNTLKRMQAEAPTILENLPRISANLVERARIMPADMNESTGAPATKNRLIRPLIPAFGIGATAMYIGLNYSPVAGVVVATLFVFITASKRF
jgi:ubiquinone biosynthesis protein